MAAWRIEAVLTWAYAAGFGGAAIPVAIWFRRHGRLPSFFGRFDMYAGPWASRYGREAFTALLVGFATLTVVASFAAWLVWQGSTVGAVLTLLLLPFELWCWIGFELPIAEAVGAVRVILLLIGWLS